MNINIIEQALPKKEVKEITEVNQYQSKDNLLKYPNLKIGIIIPAFNEELNIEKVLSKIPKNLSNKLQVILVDDGSTDKTCEIAHSYNCKVLSHSMNKGYGAAIKTGLKYCIKWNYDIVLILDGDGQHDPNEIYKFIDTILYKNVDFVKGNRFYYPYSMSTTRKLCSLLISAFYLFFLHKKISDPTNGFRALSSKIIDKLNLESDYSVSQEMLLKIVPKFKFKEIPVKVYSRDNGYSFIKLRSYFTKMALFLIKYYIFPKIRKFTEKVFHKDIRKMIGHTILKT